jgi:hypothetical protein
LIGKRITCAPQSLGSPAHPVLQVRQELLVLEEPQELVSSEHWWASVLHMPLNVQTRDSGSGKKIWCCDIKVLHLYSKLNTMNLQKHIWEGWLVQDFINELEPTFNFIMDNGSWRKPFTNKDELKQWCMDNQPYYKKHIPEVYNYFLNKLNQYNGI